MIKCESCIATPNVEDGEGSAEELGIPGEVLLINGAIAPAGTYNWFQQLLCQILVGHRGKFYDCKNDSSMELTSLENGKHSWLKRGWVAMGHKILREQVCIFQIRTSKT